MLQVGLQVECCKFVATATTSDDNFEVVDEEAESVLILRSS